MEENNSNNSNYPLLADISRLIEESRNQLAYTTNAVLTYLYWKIGKRINENILKDNRAVYGKQTVVMLSKQLVNDYGKSFEEKNLRRMIQFAVAFLQDEIVVTMSRHLSWSHILVLLPLKQPLQREFYAEMSRIENWNLRTLRKKVDSMLYERTAISKKPDEIVGQELKELRENDNLTPDLIFRDPYILNFLGLKNAYSEKSLEDSIIRELESFILELGQGFAFVERQKRMVIDGEDFKLDLLFYHRKLKRLIAIDLKLGKFKPGYKSQMELYLRWLEKYEIQPGEETPMGLILCAEGNQEQIELLQLDKAGIKVAEYLTELPDKNLLRDKLHQTIEISKKRMKKL